MNAAAGFSRLISQVMPAVMIRVITKSSSCSMIIALMSPIFSTSFSQRPATPCSLITWKISTPFSTAAIAFSPICMTRRLRMFAHVRPKIEASSFTTPLRSKVSGSSMPASPS